MQVSIGSGPRRRALFLFTQTFFCVVFFLRAQHAVGAVLTGRLIWYPRRPRSERGKKWRKKHSRLTVFFLSFSSSSFHSLCVDIFFLLVCICEPTLSFSHLGAIVSCSNTHNTFYLKSSPSLSSAWNSTFFFSSEDDSVGEKMLIHADALLKKIYLLP
jgi:hypothetical protein